MARYLIDRYSGKEYGPAKQTSKQNQSLFWNVQVSRYNNFMDEVIFSRRGERPNGKHLHCKRCFSFSSKGWINSFLTWPLHVLLSSLRKQPTSRDSTSGCPAMSAVFPGYFSSFWVYLRLFFFHGGFIGLTTDRFRWMRYRNHYKTVCV